MKIIPMGELLGTKDSCPIAWGRENGAAANGPSSKSHSILHRLQCAFNLIMMLFGLDNYSDALIEAEVYWAMFRYSISGLPQLLSFWHLELLLAKAYIYHWPGTDEGPRIINEVIAEMKKSKYTEIPSAWNKRLREEYTRLMGLAYHLLGYYFWMNRHDLIQGIIHSRKALKYYEAIQDEEGIATVLDNMARMYTLMGEKEQASVLHHRSLMIRVAFRHGGQYRLVLGIISGAWINMEKGCLNRAEFQLGQALLRCENEGRQRGLGLIHIAYGHLYRLRAAEAGLEAQERCALLHQGLVHLHQAEYIFRQLVEEPVRLIEVIYELACIYRDLTAIKRPGEPLAAECQENAARNFRAARRLAEFHHASWNDQITQAIPAGWTC